MSYSDRPMHDVAGNVYESNNYGKFKVLGEAIPIGYNPNVEAPFRYVIQFLNTGYVTDASWDAIAHGRVLDKTAPGIAGVGCIGMDLKPTTDPWAYQFYKSWNDMMNRCYNETDADYPMYGALGIKVDERWHKFSNFVLDVPFLPQYEKKVMYPSMYQLDKDFLQFHVPKEQRIYSRNTCIWLSKPDNILLMSKDRDASNGLFYIGVIFRDRRWKVRINGLTYGAFSNAKAAANYFNFIYPKVKGPFNDINVFNNVEYMPLEEVLKYSVGSTTIDERVEPPKVVRSDSTPQINFDLTI